MPISFKLLPQLARAAAARTFWTAGTSKLTRMPIIAMTTSSSMSVKATRRLPGTQRVVRMRMLLSWEGCQAPRGTEGLASTGHLQVVASGTGRGDDLDGQRRLGLGL